MVILLIVIGISISNYCFGENMQHHRFLKQIEILGNLEDSNSARLLDKLRDKGRGPLFMLEGLAKVYEKQFPDEMGELRDQTKFMEDRVGQLVARHEHIEFAEVIGVPDEVRGELKREERAYRVKVLEELREEGWMGNKMLKSWKRIIKSLEWPDEEKDRKYLRKRFKKFAEKMEDGSWDMSELQEGIHEFRRRVRWMLIYSQGLDGQIALWEGHPSVRGFDSLLMDPIANGKYSSLPVHSKVTEPVLFPRSIYLAMTKTVKEIGKVKDIGEAAFEWLPEAILKSGLAESHRDAERLASEWVKRHPDYQEVYPKAREWYGFLKKTDMRYGSPWNQGLFPALTEAFRVQKGWDAEDCQNALAGISP